MDIKDLMIGTLFEMSSNNDTFKLIGYNSDRTRIFYISIHDKIIYGNLKECSIDMIHKIL